MSISDIEDNDSNYETDSDTDNEDPNKELTTQWGTQYSHLGRLRFSVKQNPIVTFARFILSVWAV